MYDLVVTSKFSLTRITGSILKVAVTEIFSRGTTSTSIAKHKVCSRSI